jgi:hypothetical protein
MFLKKIKILLIVIFSYICEKIFFYNTKEIFKKNKN